MEKEFTCASCSSKSKGTPGTCCGAERKDVASHVCSACQTGTGEHNHGEGHSDKDGHEHHAKEGAGVCSSCQSGAGAHTCAA